MSTEKSHIKQLGIVVITYNRPNEMLALAKSIVQQKDAAIYLQEVIIVNNASTTSYHAVETFIAENPDIPFNYINSKENLGVSRGRNYAAQQATAPFLLFLDDDAEFEKTDSVTSIIPMLKDTPGQRPVAAISLKVLYYDTQEMQVNAFPHKQFNRHKHQHTFNTYYYTGLAHILKKEVLEKAGYYPVDFFYGMEEYDLSYRILNMGYRIVYNDAVVVLHKESPLGRTTPKEKLQMMWVNKSKVAYRYLPIVFFYTTALLWSVEYLKKTKLDIKGFFIGWKKIYRIPRTEKRTMISKDTLAYLRACDARLYY